MADKLPRDLKAAEVMKALERAGGQRRAGKGSHCNVKMPNGQVVTIPIHGDMKVGLLAAVVKRAGLSMAEFLELAGR